jgi:DNA polymerase III subunit epsilon
MLKSKYVQNVPRAMPTRTPGFAVVDVETTGLFPTRGDRIVEIAIVVVTERGDVVDEWSSLVNPGRAVACADIHGISSIDVRRAPTFAQIVGEANARLSGRAVVAHNAPFDLEFLEFEYARAGWPLPSAPYLCTLEASHVYLPQLQRRRLSVCCSCAGIALDTAHTALVDARATAALLGCYLDPSIPPCPTIDHLELPRLAADIVWPDIPRSPGLELPRPAKSSDNIVAAAPGALARLLEDLPLPRRGTSQSLSDASGYIELLIEVLEDGVLTDEEANALLVFAKRYKLTRPQVMAAHREFLISLARRIVHDAKVTRDERQELLAAAEVLGLGADVVKSVVDEAKDALAAELGANCRALPDAWQYGEPLRIGDGVAFTGCDDLERAQLEGRALAAGLRVIGSVSRKTVMLVTDGADPNTNKARNAREYGTRIVTPEVFSAMIEYVQRASD